MMTFPGANMTVSELLRRLALPAAAVLLLTTPGAFAQEARTSAGGELTSDEEIKQFCSNIAEPARDQRYLLQKQELDKLRADVDSRIAEMQKRRDEYQDWLKRRDDS
jgi:flagellar motility protein MotE (MotC chaperone)